MSSSTEPARWVAIPNSVWVEVAPDLWMFQNEGRNIQIGLRLTGSPPPAQDPGQAELRRSYELRRQYEATRIPTGGPMDTPDRSDTWLIWRVDAVGGTTYWERDSEAEAHKLLASLTSTIAVAGLVGKVHVQRGRVPDLDWEPGEGDGRV